MIRLQGGKKPFSLMSLLFGALFLIAVIFGIMLLFYIFFFLVIAMAIFTLIHNIRRRFFTAPVKKTTKIKSGRIIDSDDWKVL